MRVKPLSPPFGAEIDDLDLARDLDDVTFAQIEQVFNERSVVLFRNQRITHARHVEFSRRFGELEIHVLREYVRPEHPEIYVLSNIIENGRPVGIKDAGNYWHTDLSYTQAPSRGSIMCAIEVPQKDGAPLGDTLFASTAAAYDALAPDMKAKLQGLQAIHRFWDRYIRERKAAGSDVLISEERRAGTPDVVHPIIRTHPHTGQKCIYVNEGFTVGIVGMPEDEGRGLLNELFAHCTKPEFVYRHQWRVGDLVMWDNCATLHRATVDYALPQRRLMQRTTLKGTAVF
ncbi:MAG: TauD/TfdA family dioxygenase [Betaproteobacteria bacterium]|nr:TauD/TfdA family dioxygenase [Betaproteobacteria bacterium]